MGVNIEKAKKFMETKAKLLGIPELAEGWVMEWLETKGEEEVGEWIQELKSFGSPDKWWDSVMCPFCFLLREQGSCFVCPWGEKYGVCYSCDSLYGTTLKRIDEYSYWIKLKKGGHLEALWQILEG